MYFHCNPFLPAFTVRNTNGKKSTILSYTLICFDWGTFLSLIVLALFFVKGNLDDYSNQKTSISVDREPIRGYPTLGICPTQHPNLIDYSFDLGSDINITYFFSSDR